MKRWSALGSGASTLLQQLLCRLPPRCPGPQPSSSPTPSPVLFGQVQLSVRARISTGVRGDRWGIGKSVELEVHTSLALT